MALMACQQAASDWPIAVIAVGGTWSLVWLMVKMAGR